MSFLTVMLILSISIYFIVSIIISLFMYQVGEVDPNTPKYKEIAFHIMLFLFGPFIVLFFLLIDFFS
jgi:hypothetical protein